VTDLPTDEIPEPNANRRTVWDISKQFFAFNWKLKKLRSKIFEIFFQYGHEMKLEEILRIIALGSFFYKWHHPTHRKRKNHRYRERFFAFNCQAKKLNGELRNRISITVHAT
jgi:hypothetical protein